MEIRVNKHTLERAIERGASEDEIKDVIATGFEIPSKGYRKGRAKGYEFNQKRLHIFYEQKRVEVIYTIESDKIETITVYVSYGSWKEQK